MIPRGAAAGHPCRIEDARFSPLHEEHGVTVGLARLPGGATLVYTESDVFGESLPAWMRGAGRAKGPVRLLDGLRARLREN